METEIASIGTLPLELFYIIASFLSNEDLLAIRQVSKRLYTKAQEPHLERIFGTRKYFGTVPDLDALITFSQHPSKANLWLKNLKIDLSLPYIRSDDRWAISPMDLARIHGKYTHHKRWALDRVCGENWMRHENALADKSMLTKMYIAFQNLPNLQRIEFCSSRPRTAIPGRVVLAHYPELSVLPIADYMMDVYRLRERYSAPAESIGELFGYTISALLGTPNELRAIRIDDTCKDIRQCVDISWFHANRHSFPHLKEAFKNLREIELATSTDLTYYGEGYKELSDSLTSFDLFLRDVIPHIRSFSLCSSTIEGVDRMGNTPYHLDGRYPFYAPMMLLNPPLRFPNIRKLHFQVLAFSEGEIKNFLILHKDTLREVAFTNCLLQSKYQIWSRIFSLLETDLTLQTFEYDHALNDAFINDEYPDVKAIPWFRVYGDVRKENHYCSMYPKTELNRPFAAINFKKAMTLVYELEEAVICKDKVDIIFYDDGCGIESDFEELAGPAGSGLFLSPPGMPVKLYSLSPRHIESYLRRIGDV
ncbi:hypothetical protein ABW19_dt0209428 [Dactylella cylindrospora]|nr:hypothetical protein ABW19_dt0209428 [Dactylella cylindrospora]